MGNAVMSIIIRIPDPETGDLIPVELTSDLQVNCLDQAVMEREELMAFMTGQESSFKAILEQIRNNPISSLCDSNVIPLAKLGVLSCELTLQAFYVHISSKVESKDPVVCGDQAFKLVDMCRKQWGRRRYEFSRINHARQDLTICWNKTINQRRKAKESMPDFGDDMFVSLALDCASFVTEFQQMLESKKGYKHPPKNPCDIARNARYLIAYHKAFYFPNFREALSAQNGDLMLDLQDIELEQGRLAVEVLEKF
jgi:hypothetical protein